MNLRDLIKTSETIQFEAFAELEPIRSYDIARFWSRAAINREADCWEWKGTLNDSGYGTFSIWWKSVKAHRFAWFITYGAIPEGMLVCHRCDNPKCVNPSHLFIGTNVDNLSDRNRKGRTARGEVNARAVLTAEQVHLIRGLRAEGMTIAEIGRRFGVTDTHVSAIALRKAWSHI